MPSPPIIFQIYRIGRAEDKVEHTLKAHTYWNTTLFRRMIFKKNIMCPFQHYYYIFQKWHEDICDHKQVENWF